MTHEHRLPPQEDATNIRRKKMKHRLALAAQKILREKNKDTDPKTANIFTNIDEIPPHKREFGISWPPEEGNTLGAFVQPIENVDGRKRLIIAHGLGSMVIEHPENADTMALISLNVETRARRNEHLALAPTLMGFLKGYVVSHPEIKTLTTTAANEATIALLAATFGKNNLHFDSAYKSQSEYKKFPEQTTVTDAITYLQEARKEEYGDPHGSQILFASINVRVDLHKTANTIDTPQPEG